MSPRPRVTSDADLLSAATRMVARVGPALTLADVAKEAGVSPATLVQRFGSKRGLLLAVAARDAAGFAGELARIRSANRSPLAALRAIGEAVAATAKSPEALSNGLAFLQMDLIDPEFHAHALAHSRTMHAELVRLLDDAAAARELASSDSRALARAVQSLFAGSLVQWAIDRNGTALDRLRADLDALLRPRIAPARRRSPRPRPQSSRS